MHNSPRVHHCGNPDPDYRHPQSFHVQTAAVIPHPGAGRNPRICQLNGTVQPPGTPGCQSVDDQNHIRTGLPHHSLKNLLGFHAGLRHHPRHKSADHGRSFISQSPLSVFPENVPGNPQMFHRAGPQGIRGNLSVSKPHYQNRVLFSGKHFFQMGGQFPGNLPVKSPIRHFHIGSLQGNIGPFGFSHSPGSGIRFDFHHRSGNLFFPVFPAMDHHSGKFCLILFIFFAVFQCQICAHSVSFQHVRSPLISSARTPTPVSDS